jgi:hypothetical protein
VVLLRSVQDANSTDLVILADGAPVAVARGSGLIRRANGSTMAVSAAPRIS